MLSRAIAASLAVLACPAFAQAQAPLVQDPPPAGRAEQRIESIVHEDAGSRIQERRYGGQTETIDVQPKGGMPSYQVDPANLRRTRPDTSRNGLTGAGGQRSWSVFSF
jgi:hypothetical protein